MGRSSRHAASGASSRAKAGPPAARSTTGWPTGRRRSPMAARSNGGLRNGCEERRAGEAKGMRVGGVDVRAFGKKVWQEFSSDDVSGMAAELSYRYFLALFPFLIFLAALGGFAASAA